MKPLPAILFACAVAVGTARGATAQDTAAQPPGLAYVAPQADYARGPRAVQAARSREVPALASGRARRRAMGARSARSTVSPRRASKSRRVQA